MAVFSLIFEIPVKTDHLDELDASDGIGELFLEDTAGDGIDDEELDDELDDDELDDDELDEFDTS